MNFSLAFQMFRNMGPRYISYRVLHEIEKRSGYLKKRHPLNPKFKSFITFEEFRSSKFDTLPIEQKKIHSQKLSSTSLAEKAERILKGEVLFFSSHWKDLGKGYDWITNPVTGYKYDINLHWSQINDFNETSGDIKDVWEKSRFSFLLSILRYDLHFNEDHSEYVFSEIEDWIEKNPVNQGPNWKCSQEISLRLFNWSYALQFYRNSPSLTDGRWKKIQNTIFWSLHHVYHHINFSRIAVRNNHAITETLCLALSKYLFPYIPETKNWSAAGRKWFEKEIAYQVYEDGSFLQFSMNYHRVVVQLLSLGLSVTEKNKEPFSEIVYNRAYKSLNFLYQNLQEENGHLPNYGNNDGALFFPLTDTEYRDFRPQLNTLHEILTGTALYSEPYLKEDLWQLPDSMKKFKDIKKQVGAISFPVGGYYLLREEDSFTFIRCGNHRDRPAQADNLHVDIWKNGENVFRDAGTYKYNTSPEMQKYFFGTSSHNTVNISGFDQMLKGSRFIWFYWTRAKYAGWEELEDRFIFRGGILAFGHINKNIVHHRVVEKLKGESIWKVSDRLENHIGEKHQQWHEPKEGSAELLAHSDGTRFTPEEIPSFYSSHYGEKESGKGTAFRFTNQISTTIKL